ncbi:Partitioning protein, parA, partial [mine drainage metagenome]
STAVFAADHLVVTVPPSNLDLASSVIFWSLLRDVMEQALKADGHVKRWEGVHVLQTRVDDTDKSTHFIRKLLAMGCEDWLLPDTIPATRVATTAASEFATVYDIERYEGSYRSIKRARELFDKAYSQFAQILNDTWDAWESEAGAAPAAQNSVSVMAEMADDESGGRHVVAA